MTCGTDSPLPVGFDPNFDDARWNTLALEMPIHQVLPGRYHGGYEVRRKALRAFSIFDHRHRAFDPVDCRALYAPDGTLWMSDVPQERMMMANNAIEARGHVFIGGLGLALFPQYLPNEVTQVTIVERSQVVVDIAGPVLQKTMTVRRHAADVRIADVAAALESDVAAYDTIFLDTWATLEPLQLPHVNWLRDVAARRLAPGGRVLAWGYGWMLRLFAAACEPLVLTPPDQRNVWLASLSTLNPRAYHLFYALCDAIQGVADEADVRRRCRVFGERITAPMLVDAHSMR
jgi:hypothetical protein